MGRSQVNLVLAVGMAGGSAAPLPCRRHCIAWNDNDFLAATENGGHVRLAHADNNDAATCKRFVDGEVSANADVTTDGHAGYNRAPLARRVARGLPRGSRVLGAEDIPMTRTIALALKLALVTGQRINEVAGIETKEFDFMPDAPVWTMPGKRTKNKKPNGVPLAPLALSLIKEARGVANDSPWLFPSPTGNGPIRRDAATKAVARAQAAIGLADFHAHDLRRTAATRMAELQVSPHTISLILNHASARKGTVTSAVYIQYSYDKEKREGLEAWGRLLGEIVGL